MNFNHLRYAWRALRHSPGFTIVALCTLAIGIGANTAMFSVVDGVLLKPLRYRDAGRIVQVSTLWTNTGKVTPRLTGGDLLDLRGDTATFQALSPYFGGEMGVQLGDHAEFVRTYFTFPEFFRVFELKPLAGRTFLDGDGNHAAVVSQGFAQRNFGSAQNAVSKTIRFESRSYPIVGVVPGTFNFPERTEVWIALPGDDSELTTSRSAFNYRSVAKLQPGISVENANARLAAIAARLQNQYPDTNRDKSFQAVQLRDQMVAQVRSMLFFLLGAVGLVLLIACANVA